MNEKMRCKCKKYICFFLDKGAFLNRRCILEEENNKVPNLGNADTPIPNLGTPWDKLPQWIKDGIKNELRWACEKHPKFPNNEFEMMCIIQEELGEAIQALNDFKHHQQGTINDVNIELLHTIVTCLRTLMAINEKEKY